MLELIIKNSYLNDYLEKFCCQASFFDFFSSQNNFSVKRIVLIFSFVYKNIVRFLAWYSKFKKRKPIKKRRRKN